MMTNEMRIMMTEEEKKKKKRRRKKKKMMITMMMMRSAARGEFLVPRARLPIMQRRAFSVVGPSAWNDLPFELRSLLMAHPSKFYISLKSFFFVRGWAESASE